MKLRQWPSLFARKKPDVRPLAKAAPLRPIRHDMTLERWQKDEALVNWARTSPEFAFMLSVIESRRPTGFPFREQPCTDTQCSVELGRHEGYSDCEAVLLAMRQFPVAAAAEIEADYDNTDYSQEAAKG